MSWCLYNKEITPLVILAATSHHSHYIANLEFTLVSFSLNFKVDPVFFASKIQRKMCAAKNVKNCDI